MSKTAFLPSGLTFLSPRGSDSLGGQEGCSFTLRGSWKVLITRSCFEQRQWASIHSFTFLLVFIECLHAPSTVSGTVDRDLNIVSFCSSG